MTRRRPPKHLTGWGALLGVLGGLAAAVGCLALTGLLPVGLMLAVVRP